MFKIIASEWLGSEHGSPCCPSEGLPRHSCDSQPFKSFLFMVALPMSPSLWPYWQKWCCLWFSDAFLLLSWKILTPMGQGASIAIPVPEDGWWWSPLCLYFVDIGHSPEYVHPQISQRLSWVPWSTSQFVWGPRRGQVLEHRMAVFETPHRSVWPVATSSPTVDSARNDHSSAS